MKKFTIKTKKAKEVVDITEKINAELAEDFSGVCHLSVLHTTAALTTADLDPGTDLDMLDAFYEMIPAHSVGEARPSGRPTLTYRHPHNPKHVPDHILSALIGTSLTLPVENGQVVLGTWQRVVLFEFNGSKEREIVMSLVKS